MKKIFLLAILIITISCSKDDDPINKPNTNNETTPVNDSITYFTLKVNDFYIGKTVNSGYLIINDNEGNILAHTQIENSKEYAFKAKKGEEKESFTVSRFIYSDQEVFQYNFLDSFFNIKKGTTWNFKGRETTSATTRKANNTSKKISLKIKNIDGYSTVYLSSPRGGLNYSASGTANSIDYDSIELHGNPNKILITVHFKEKKSKYIFIDNIQDQQKVSVDGSELKEFDSYIPINIPDDGNTYSKDLTARLTSEESFSTVWFSDIESEAASNFGILKGFYDFYIHIFASNNAENYSYRYIKRSPTLDAITVSPYSTDFKVINSSMNAFEYTYTMNQKHSTKQSTWTLSINDNKKNKFRTDNWAFRSNELPYQTIPKLPQEFLDLYPFFKVENLEYNSTGFSKGVTYENFFTDDNSFENNNTYIKESLIFTNPDYDNNKSKSFKKNKEFEEMMKEFQHYNH
ncbi:hypothetical protein [Aquimarina longa]|uniref:hypothetical protein n=1 Tax=Aquimarina longa TaxID=1080221 RepID=UPI000783D0B8|nr:hypothetical protein [Aquimarina longa]